jgi:hypothetical protein
VDPQPVFREVLGRIEALGPADKQGVLHLTSGWGVGVRTFDWDDRGAKDQGKAGRAVVVRAEERIGLCCWAGLEGI